MPLLVCIVAYAVALWLVAWLCHRAGYRWPLSRKKISKEGVKYDTGAVRSADAEAFRYDLISPIGLRRVAETCHEGAVKYTPHNWEKGMPVDDLLNHAIRHVYLYLSGDRSEDHLAHSCWGLMAAMHSEELWPQLNAGKLRSEGCKPPSQG